MCTLMNCTWQNDCNYWLCCWLLQHWDRHLPWDMIGCSLVSKHQQLKETCCFHLEGHLVLGEWGKELHRLQWSSSVGNKERGWGVRIWLVPIQTSYFWLVSFHATWLHHHSASSLYSLWAWRWTQHFPLKW